jgi:hypothetical protein
MYIATRKTTTSAPVISERAQSNQPSKVKLAKANTLGNEQLSNSPNDTNETTQSNIARLLASCGDCV